MKLPEYEPSDNVWQKIEAKLNQDSFQQVVKYLPEYEPEEKVWANISSKLNKSKFDSIKWAVAASIIVGFALYFSYKNNEVTYTKQEIAPAQNGDQNCCCGGVLSASQPRTPHRERRARMQIAGLGRIEFAFNYLQIGPQIGCGGITAPVFTRE